MKRFDTDRHNGQLHLLVLIGDLLVLSVYMGRSTLTTAFEGIIRDFEDADAIKYVLTKCLQCVHACFLIGGTLVL